MQGILSEFTVLNLVLVLTEDIFKQHSFNQCLFLCNGAAVEKHL